MSAYVTSPASLPNEDAWVYLDTDVTRYVLDVFDGWAPSDPLAPGEAERVAAFRVFLYARRPTRAMWLVTSGEVEQELMRRDAWNHLEGLLFPVNLGQPRIPQMMLDVEASRFAAHGVRPSDARHAAHAAVRPWVRFLVTNDRRLRRRATAAGLPPHLAVLSPIQMSCSLAIRPGETPPIRLDPWPPLPQWWIPR